MKYAGQLILQIIFAPAFLFWAILSYIFVGIMEFLQSIGLIS